MISPDLQSRFFTNTADNISKEVVHSSTSAKNIAHMMNVNTSAIMGSDTASFNHESSRESPHPVQPK